MLKFIFPLLVLISNCSFKKDQIENQTQQGHEELYSSPKKLGGSDADDEIRRIVIAATNDIEGQYDPTSVFFRDNYNKEKQNTTIGGVEVIEKYFRILREKYKGVLLLESGDIFSEKDMSITRNFYNQLEYDAITVGLSDFNLKLPGHVSSSSHLIKEFAKNSTTPVLLSNLYELKTARVIEWPGTKPYILKVVNGVKVGIIGLIADDVVPKTPINNRVGFFVESMLQSTLKNARLLRSLGADMVIVLTHQGLNCGHEIAAKEKLPLEKVNFEPLHQGVCETKGILGDYIRRLPPSLVDVVIGGRHHEKMANFVNGMFFLSSFPKGKSFSFAEFYIDTKEKKVLKERSIIYQPVVFCHEFFKETNDCYTEDPTVNHLERVPALFLGEKIQLDNATSTPLETKTTQIDIENALRVFNADLTLKPADAQNTQLLTVNLSGKQLLKILEEDFNSQEHNRWQPNPFEMKNGLLYIRVARKEIEDSKSYRILTNAQGLQNHSILKEKIKSNDLNAYPYFSWSNLPKTNDEVQMKMSAQAQPNDNRPELPRTE